ncbi:MAG: hypothetical protein MJK04_19760, partial [Psychrosphaera sp.]|nr:hypothetical protein [Psychrosphaera sp.]
MNSKTLVFSVLLGLGLNANTAAAKEYAIAISPNVSKAQAKVHYSKAVGFLITMQEGDSALVINGDSLATLGRFTIPKDPIYASPKARVKYNKAVVGKMAKLAKAANAPSSRIAGAVRLPQLLRHIGANKIAPEIDVIVLGSALYGAPAQPAFSMKDGVFPSDGHLKHGRDITPFGVVHPAQLSGLRIHLGFNDTGLSDRKLHFIERFWALYAQAQGAELVSFTKDLPTLFNRAKNNVEPPQNNYKQGNSDKLQMIRLAPQKLQSQSIYNRPVSTSVLKAKQLQKAKNVQLGISWQCQDCDLDLYSRARPDAQVLWYGHTKSPLGIYFKDYQKSPDTKNGYETIAYTTAIDLRALQIFVNFYKGDAPKGVRGEVRISVDGKTYSTPFHIKAKRGG